MTRIGPAAGRSVRRNTLWNFAGIAAPVPVALIAIPLLISGLGQERFGLLTIAWAVMGYFSVFDFGLSRATTIYLAQACDDGDDSGARRLFWSSTAAHLALGSVGGAILFLASSFISAQLDVEPALRRETVTVLNLLAVSVPIVVLTSVTRGLLEALHRFDLVNIVKLPATLLTYLGPLAALPFTDRLPPVIVVILVSRAVVLITYLVMCFRVLPAIRTLVRPRASDLRPLIAMGGWITVGTVLIPIIVSVDRFVIGSAVSVAAVVVYAAPYEVVTKLWMFSASLLGVLFPQFSTLVGQREALQALYWRAVSWLVLCTAPISVLMIAFAPEFLEVWLGPEIARDGVAVAQWLTIGVLINVVAQVPYTVLQATGHADATGKLQLLELPIYSAAIWFAALYWGVVGVAIGWTLRAAVDAILMFTAVRMRLGLVPSRGGLTRLAVTAGATVAVIIWCWKMVPLVAPALIPKALIVAVSVAAFTYFTSFGLGITLSRSTLTRES